MLDGLEVTLAGSLAGALKASPVLHSATPKSGSPPAPISPARCSARCSSAGSPTGSAARSCSSSRSSVYLVATAATAFSWDFWSFALFRFMTGAGIGGEYAAINSAIQELIPARVRGWTDLVINGSFWLGAALGALGAIVLLDPAVIDPESAGALAFVIGAVLALVIFFMRLWMPESPRWLMTHGRAAEAENVVRGIERRVIADAGARAAGELPTVRLRARAHTPLAEVIATVHRHRRRALLGLVLMTSQAFFYNAIFFTYALVLTDFYGVPSSQVGWYILPFAAGNFLGPLLLGRFFDTIGRAPMIASTYALSGVLLPAPAICSCKACSAPRSRRGLDRDLLLRVGRGKLGLSHRQRKLPAGNPRAGDRVLLCGRHRHRRHRGAVAVRRADRHRLAHEPIRRLSARCGADDRRGRDCGVLRGAGGAEAAGAGGAAAGVRGLGAQEMSAL